MSFKFTAKDIEEMKSQLREAGYTGKFYDAPHVVYTYNVWIVAPLKAFPGGKTK